MLLGMRSQVPFSPYPALFTSGEDGAWFDPSDFVADWRRNLLTYTEQFDNAAWQKTNLNTTGTPAWVNVEVAPDGTQTADKLIRANGSTAAANLLQGLSAGAVLHTASIYVKAGEWSGFEIYARNSSDTAVISRVDLLTGDVTSNNHEIIVVGVGNDWFRVTSKHLTTSGILNVYYTPTLNGSTAGGSSTGDGTSGIYIWGAQLEVGSTATAYQQIVTPAITYASLYRPVMFTDTTGTTPVTAVGQTVALMLDKSQGLTLGPELFTNGDFATNSDWSLATGSGGTIAIASGLLTVTRSTGYTAAVQAMSFVSGKTYKITVNARRTSGTGSAAVVVRTTDSVVSGTARFTALFTPTGDFATYTGYYVCSNTETAYWQIGVGTASSVIEYDTVSAVEIPGNHASQATVAARPVLQQDADGQLYLQNDEVDDALTVTFPNLGSDCTVAYVTASEVFLYEGQTISGAYTLPATDLYNLVIVDRALTLSEKVNLIRYLASKVDGVNYGGEIDRLTLIAINAVDVFVYDTSKDSDGGAWRNNTSSTSWYNETLNTATRGSRRQFPAVAVIVAESNKVTIYDADDPSLPMWMVFNGGSSNLIRNTSITSVSAVNGIIGIASTPGTSSVTFHVVSLIADESDDYGSGGRYLYNGDIAARNSGLSTTLVTASAAIVNSTVNDVAMTVLPGAPTDPTTGLPVPTIAVATAGGVSVITDSGVVYDTTVGFTPVTKVAFDGDGGLWWARSAALYLSYATISDYTTADGFGDLVASSIAGNQEFDLQVGTVATALNVVGEGDLSITNGLGLGRHYLNTSALVSAPNTHLHALITSTYNTGWMNGAIKGAFLSDTSTASLVASGELVTNGTFNTDISGWTVSADTSWDASGRLKYEVASGPTGVSYVITQALTLAANTNYVLRLDAEKLNSVFTNAIILINQTQGNSSTNLLTSAIGINSASVGSSTTFVSTFKTGSDTSVFFQVLVNAIPTGEGFYLDNISVQLADADRSVNNKGLIVNGTITRTAVASGANLVAYSGFSASNYLEQPYNSALDFGTGDFCVMGWFKVSLYATRTILCREDASATGSSILLRSVSAGVEFFANTSLTNAAITTSVPSLNNWVFVAAKKESNVLSIFINGALASNTPTVSANLTNTSALLRVGQRVSTSNPFEFGSLALWRISSTAPTATQIAKIYADELPLFQANARATLYGASDAVTALAHDPDTGLLHVGTSAGRSVFRGLERLSNTTTSVAATISASGGLVVSK